MERGDFGSYTRRDDVSRRSRQRNRLIQKYQRHRLHNILQTIRLSRKNLEKVKRIPIPHTEWNGKFSAQPLWEG